MLTFDCGQAESLTFLFSSGLLEAKTPSQSPINDHRIQATFILTQVTKGKKKNQKSILPTLQKRYIAKLKA